jgi:hypothetical protein
MEYNLFLNPIALNNKFKKLLRSRLGHQSFTLRAFIRMITFGV